MMHTAPVTGAIQSVGIDIIRPMRSKLTRITPPRSFDFSLVDRAEKKYPAYPSRPGTLSTPFAQTGEPAVTIPAETALDAEPTTADAQPSVESLGRMIDMLEEQNAFLRNRLVAAEELIKSILALLAEREKR
ncbi:MAG: hypothetical protein H7838_02490 [Magnetococcus sp. DMHC-8]